MCRSALSVLPPSPTEHERKIVRVLRQGLATQRGSVWVPLGAKMLPSHSIAPSPELAGARRR
jgi:hypothetical protein